MSIFFQQVDAQTTIAVQDFDGATPTMSYTNTGGTLYTGNSGAGDIPTSSAFYTSSTTAFGRSNGTGIFTSANITGLASYTSKYFEFRLGSWSIGSVGNGADATDNVVVAISLDGGTTFSNEMQISGPTAANATWHYTTGSGIASVVYDGNNAPYTLAPAGSGARTTDGYSTVRIDLPNSSTNAIIRITLLNNATAERWTIDDVKLVGTISAPCSPTTAPTLQANTFTATPLCTSATLNWANGNGSNRLVVVSTSSFSSIPSNGVNYNANSVFTFGAPIGAGNFVVYNGTGGTVTVTGLTAGTTYYVHIFEYNGTTTNCDESYYTSGNSEYTFTTNTSCSSSTPQIRAILADACGSNEGRDELVIVENGSSPLAISDISITFPTSGLPTYCNSGCGINTLGNNPTYVNDLNTLAGCTLFYYADPIPANAMIVVFTGNPPTFVFDYSSLCPSSLQYYVVFCNNPTDLTGRFGNSGATPRTLTMTFGGTNEAVTYIPDNLSGNGSFVNFDDPGNPTYNTNPGCIYPLGNPFSFFNASKFENNVFLTWNTIKTYQEKKYVIQRMNKEGTLETLGETNDQNLNTNLDSYSFVDNRPLLGANYYRIVGYDNNNEPSYSDFRLVNFQSEDWSVSLNQGYLLFSQTLLPGETAEIYNLQGQLIANWDIQETTNALPIQLNDGAYLISLTSKQGNQETKRVLLVN